MHIPLFTFRRGVRVATPLLALGTAALTAALAACSDASTGPAAAAPAFVAGPHPSLAPTPIAVVSAVTRVAPLARDSAMSFTVQPGGTTVSTPDHEITASFPAGFVAKPTVFTVTRKAGAAVAYDFQPSGTFSKPVVVTLRPGATAWSALVSALGGAQGAYVPNWSQVDPATGTASVNEFVPTTVNPIAGTVTLTLSHFSGYMVTMGHH